MQAIDEFLITVYQNITVKTRFGTVKKKRVLVDYKIRKSVEYPVFND